MGTRCTVTMSATRPTVQIVESERSRAVMLSEWLSDCFSTSVATSGVGALGDVDDDTDIVVVAQQLSDMRAGELLEGLRADGHDCHVVLLSEGGVVADYEGDSFGRVLEWPLNPERLRAAVDEVAGVSHPLSAGSNRLAA
jgi:CheY-like chemotaxis protein